MADYDNTAAVPRNLAAEPWASVRTADYANSHPELVTGDGTWNLHSINVVAGDRFLAYNTEQNGPHPSAGIWVVGAEGSTRATDCDSSDEFIYGRTVKILEGGRAGETWRFETTGAIVVGTTHLMFRQVLATDAALTASTFSDTGAASNTIPTTIQADWSNTAAAANTIPETAAAPFDNSPVGLVILP